VLHIRVENGIQGTFTVDESADGVNWTSVKKVRVYPRATSTQAAAEDMAREIAKRHEDAGRKVQLTLP
jgi:hypothetical protein